MVSSRPDIAVEGGFVYWPDPPFDFCDDWPGQPPPCQPSDSTYRDRLMRLYTAEQWFIPDSAQAHHIKPRRWGGGDNPGDNGTTWGSLPNFVFLDPITHQAFTTWWAPNNFSNPRW
jgi:hypothetical protein